jgi:hypothetical protein
VIAIAPKPPTPVLVPAEQNFRTLLEEGGVSVSEHVLANALVNFGSVVTALASFQQAKLIYDRAKLIPQSRTIVNLSHQNISVG